MGQTKKDAKGNAVADLLFDSFIGKIIDLSMQTWYKIPKSRARPISIGYLRASPERYVCKVLAEVDRETIRKKQR